MGGQEGFANSLYTCALVLLLSMSPTLVQTIDTQKDMPCCFQRCLAKSTCSINIHVPLRSPVENISCIAIYKRKEYFGIAYCNHTAWYQLQTWCFSRITFNFHKRKKLFVLILSMLPQRYIFLLHNVSYALFSLYFKPVQKWDSVIPSIINRTAILKFENKYDFVC